MMRHWQGNSIATAFDLSGNETRLLMAGIHVGIMLTTTTGNEPKYWQGTAFDLAGGGAKVIMDDINVDQTNNIRRKCPKVIIIIEVTFAGIGKAQPLTWREEELK
ncbi:hypothetical protein J6590_000810 [Homalodisca vitripennis]|nr:hypothetical protein J6590_000810 [Homalodisca vitripennis]